MTYLCTRCNEYCDESDCPLCGWPARDPGDLADAAYERMRDHE